MKTVVILLTLALLTFNASAQYRMVQGTVWALNDPRAPWTSFGYMCVSGFTTDGDLILQGFATDKVKAPTTMIGNNVYAATHIQRRNVGSQIVLRNYPLAGRLNPGDDIPPGIIAMRVRADIAGNTRNESSSSFENNQGYSSRIKTTSGQVFTGLIYDMGVDYQPSVRPLTPAEQAVAAKKKNSQAVKTFKWIYSQATNGSVSAQCSLGEYYLKGIGTPTNQVAGMEWLQRAANAGDVRASNVLFRISNTNIVVAEE